MLYITTRDKYDAFTNPKAMRSDRGPDGGLYLPMRMPSFSGEELNALADDSFGNIVAKILNLFFSAGLCGWDVEFCVGRYPTKLKELKQGIMVAELWHNADNGYSQLENALSAKVRECRGEEKTTSWLRIAIRIAVLFAMYGEMLRCGKLESGMTFDVALATGDFSCAMAVWYARQMGLPVSCIICGCNDNSGVWDLLHLGQVHTDISPIATTTPDADFGLPPEMERLVSGTLGQEEAKRFIRACEERADYALTPDKQERLRQGMFAAVVSMERLDSVIPSVYRTMRYILSPYSALAYGGLLDYRTRNRENRPALLLADRDPVTDWQTVTAAMGISLSELKNTLGII